MEMVKHNLVPVPQAADDLVQYMADLAVREEEQLRKVSSMIFLLVMKQVSLEVVIRESELLENILETEYDVFMSSPKEFYTSKEQQQEVQDSFIKKLGDVRKSIKNFKTYGGIE